LTAAVYALQRRFDGLHWSQIEIANQSKAFVTTVLDVGRADRGACHFDTTSWRSGDQNKCDRHRVVLYEKAIATTKFGGLGVELLISRAIFEAHYGRI
jgi:hypothetical protein